MGKREIDTVNWEQEFPEVPMIVHEAIDRANQMVLAKGSRKKRHIPMKRTFLLVACITLLSGMTVFAATGIWRQRMAEMNAQKIEDFMQTMDARYTPSYHYSRGLTEEEKKVMSQLRTSYENGLFPEAELTLLSSVEDYKGKGIGYEPQSGTFCIPDSELSHEQFLQIIDFMYRIDYVLEVKNSMQEDTEKIVIEQEDKEEVDSIDIKVETALTTIMQDYEKLNDKVDYYEVMLEGDFTPEGEGLLQRVAANEEYLFLGFSGEIRRMDIGTADAECIYQLDKNQKLFAIDVDRNNHIYLSINEYVEASDSYVNRILQLNEDGEVLVEYDTRSAKYDDEKTMDSLMAFKMLADDDGKLYVKTMWCSKVLLFVFDAEGNYVDMIYSPDYKVHVSGGICFDEEGFLYVLGLEEIIKIDTVTGKVTEAYPYTSDEMGAAVNLLYPMEEDSFYLFSYDGLFTTSRSADTADRILAPWESEVFAEGCKSYTISNDTFVAVNLKELGLLMTYFRIK